MPHNWRKDKGYYVYVFGLYHNTCNCLKLRGCVFVNLSITCVPLNISLRTCTDTRKQADIHWFVHTTNLLLKLILLQVLIQDCLAVFPIDILHSAIHRLTFRLNLYLRNQCVEHSFWNCSLSIQVAKHASLYLLLSCIYWKLYFIKMLFV